MIRPVVLAIAVALVAAVPAAADTTQPAGAYAGTTASGAKVSFTVSTARPRQVRRFAIGYTSRCSDGERLKSTFRFFPTTLAAGFFRIAGSTSGTLADGRAYTSKVKLAGRFSSVSRARGTFRLATRIPEPSGGVATCTTVLVRWTAAHS